MKTKVDRDALPQVTNTAQTRGYIHSLVYVGCTALHSVVSHIHGQGSLPYYCFLTTIQKIELCVP